MQKIFTRSLISIQSSQVKSVQFSSALLMEGRRPISSALSGTTPLLYSTVMSDEGHLSSDSRLVADRSGVEWELSGVWIWSSWRDPEPEPAGRQASRPCRGHEARGGEGEGEGRDGLENVMASSRL